MVKKFIGSHWNTAVNVWAPPGLVIRNKYLRAYLEYDAISVFKTSNVVFYNTIKSIWYKTYNIILLYDRFICRSDVYALASKYGIGLSLHNAFFFSH